MSRVVPHRGIIDRSIMNKKSFFNEFFVSGFLGKIIESVACMNMTQNLDETRA